MAVVNIASPAKKPLFTAISLSKRTITRRIEDMLSHVRGSLKDICTGFEYFSAAFDKGRDLKDTAPLIVFVRGVIPSL